MRFFKICMVAVAVVALIGAVLASPLFVAVSTEVIGLSRLNEGDIRATIELNQNVNLFMFDSRSAKKKLLQNNYVENAVIIKDYKNKTIEVRVTERLLSGYVQYPGGVYLYIDQYGYVLEAANYYTERLPLVLGLKVDDFTVGKPLYTDSDKTFQVVVTLAQLFNEYELESDVIRVDVTDVSNIHFYIDKLDVEFGSFGSAADTDEKIRTLKAILPTLPDANVVLDIKDISKPARTRLLT